MAGLFHKYGHFPPGYNPIVAEPPPGAIRIGLHNLDALYWLTDYVWASSFELEYSAAGSAYNSMFGTTDLELSGRSSGDFIRVDDSYGDDLVFQERNTDRNLIKGNYPSIGSLAVADGNGAISGTFSSPAGHQHSRHHNTGSEFEDEDVVEDGDYGHTFGMSVFKYRYGPAGYNLYGPPSGRFTSGNIGMWEGELWYTPVLWTRERPGAPWSAASERHMELNNEANTISVRVEYMPDPPQNLAALTLRFRLYPFEDSDVERLHEAQTDDGEGGLMDFVDSHSIVKALNGGNPIGYIDPSEAVGPFRLFPKIPIYGAASISSTIPEEGVAPSVSLGLCSASVNFKLQANYRSWGGIYNPETGARM